MTHQVANYTQRFQQRYKKHFNTVAVKRKSDLHSGSNITTDTNTLIFSTHLEQGELYQYQTLLLKKHILERSFVYC